MNGRSQAIRLPKKFRVAGDVVSLTRVPGGILIRERDPIVTNSVRAVERGELSFPGLAVRTPAQFLEDIQWQP